MTLNVLYRLTTEMGEGRGCENDETMTVYKNALKLIYCPWGGGGDLDNPGTTKVCLALHQEMELLGCNIKFIKNQIFG